MRDMTNNIQIKRCISPFSEAGTTPLVGQIIDRKGYNTLTYIILTGAIADVDATFTILLEEGAAANLSDAAAVADVDMLSQSTAAPETAAAFQFDDDNEVRKLGYIGNKQYTRLTITPVANASAAVLAAVAVLGDPSREAVIQEAA